MTTISGELIHCLHGAKVLRHRMSLHEVCDEDGGLRKGLQSVAEPCRLILNVAKQELALHSGKPGTDKKEGSYTSHFD
jgi:hypothetical protein